MDVFKEPEIAEKICEEVGICLTGKQKRSNHGKSLLWSVPDILTGSILDFAVVNNALLQQNLAPLGLISRDTRVSINGHQESLMI